MSMVSGNKHPNEETVLQMSGFLEVFFFFFFAFSYLKAAEDIKKRWQEYTEELYKRDLHDPDNQDAVITYLEPDILECKV